LSLLAQFELKHVGLAEALELFPNREAAEAMLADCLADEPEWVDVLMVERVEFEAGSPGMRSSGIGRPLR
jgi:hypothetical protein